MGAGAREVHLMEEPMAAALGAGMPVEEARVQWLLILVVVPQKLQSFH